MTVLIAEDNERMRKMLKSMLIPLAGEIYECANGQTAVESYLHNKPDWTLMDIEMPVLDGISATRMIKGSDPGAKVIIVTNYDSKVLRRNAQEAGAIKYILKENLNEVIDFIKQLNQNHDLKYQ